MCGNSFKIWSLTLGLLLAPSYLSLTGATPAAPPVAPAAVPSIVGPSMSSSVPASALPSEPNVNHQDAINKALERAVNLENEAEAAAKVESLLNRPAGQLRPDERAINYALEKALEKGYTKVANLLQEEEQPGGAPFPVSKEGVSPSSVPASAVPSVVGPSMPSSVSASALPSETYVNQDAINYALERAVNLENEAEVQNLLNRPAGQLCPEERVVKAALSDAKSKRYFHRGTNNALNNKLAHENTLSAFSIPLDEEGRRKLKLRSELARQKVATMEKIVALLEGELNKYKYKPAVPTVTSPKALTLAELGIDNPELLNIEKRVNDSEEHSKSQYQVFLFRAAYLTCESLRYVSNEDKDKVKGKYGFTLKQAHDYLVSHAKAGNIDAKFLLHKLYEDYGMPYPDELNYSRAVAQTVSPSQAAIPGVVGPSMPSSVPASAGNSPPGGAPFSEEFAPSFTPPTSMPPEAPTFDDAHIDGSEVDLNRYMISYSSGRGFDNYTK